MGLIILSECDSCKGLIRPDEHYFIVMFRQKGNSNLTRPKMTLCKKCITIKGENI